MTRSPIDEGFPSFGADFARLAKHLRLCQAHIAAVAGRVVCESVGESVLYRLFGGEGSGLDRTPQMIAQLLLSGTKAELVLVMENIETPEGAANANDNEPFIAFDELAGVFSGTPEEIFQQVWTAASPHDVLDTNYEQLFGRVYIGVLSLNPTALKAASAILSS